MNTPPVGGLDNSLSYANASDIVESFWSYVTALSRSWQSVCP